MNHWTLSQSTANSLTTSNKQGSTQSISSETTDYGRSVWRVESRNLWVSFSRNASRSLINIVHGSTDRVVGELRTLTLGKDAIGLLQSLFCIPFMTMQIEIMTWSSIISCTVRCLRMRIETIHNVMRTEIRMGTNPVKIHPVECPLDLEQNRMGLLNSENEDVTNVTSESSNPYTSLKFQRTRWKQSSSWTWPMSPPSTSSDITCNQHSFPFQTIMCSLSDFSTTTKSVT